MVDRVAQMKIAVLGHTRIARGHSLSDHTKPLGGATNSRAILTTSVSVATAMDLESLGGVSVVSGEVSET